MKSLLEQTANRPLADRLRPKNFDEIVGQPQLTDEKAPLRRLLESYNLPSFILWGPPGCGKTTIARLIAEKSGLHYEQTSAIFSGVSELRGVFERARQRRQNGDGTLLFVDEVHRFNRAQQDSFLPVIEDGTLILVGATTQNPSFELNPALLSRARVFTLERLNETALEQLLQRAEKVMKAALPLTRQARTTLKDIADGDGRYLLNMAEQLYQLSLDAPLSPENLAETLQRRAPLYDKGQESHYNLISALHKSLRGSDCDAALYWFARMLAGGEDPHYIARRLLRFAVEDIGLADPRAAEQALTGWQSYERLGSPEGELALSQVVIYLATAPKSNANYTAFKAAMRSAKENGSLNPPKHILNAPTGLMRDLGYGAGYKYDHDALDNFSGQSYFPESMERVAYYKPKDLGFERDIAKRLQYWQKLRAARDA